MGSLRRRRASIALPLTSLVLAGCASVRVAEMALPGALVGRTPETIEGLGIGRGGEFSIGALAGTFSRGRDRTELFSIVGWDRATTRYRLAPPEGTPIEAACIGKATQVGGRLWEVNVQPFTYTCEWRGPRTGQMTVSAPAASTTGRAMRSGSITMGSVIVNVTSVHELRGSALPLAVPIGYVFEREGRPVGAVELNGTTPRLWRPASGDPAHDAVTLGAVALALLWDPADRP